MSNTTPNPVTVRPTGRSWLQLIAVEGKLIIRDTPGIIVPLALPVLIMVMNGISGPRRRIAEFGGLPALDAVVLPLTLTMIVAVIAMINVPSNLAVYRKSGVLRRLAVTPASPTMVLVGQVVVNVLHTLTGIAFASAIAVIAFDVSPPRSAALAVGVFALTCCAMYALGMLLAAVAPSASAALAIGLLLFFGNLALGGGFAPGAELPGPLDWIGDHTPFGAGMQSLTAAWIGEQPDIGQLAALAITTVIAGAGAAKLFRWT